MDDNDIFKIDKAVSDGLAQLDKGNFDIDTILGQTLPKMPDNLICIPFEDKNQLDPSKKVVIPPGFNIFLASAIHQTYDEAETMTLKHMIKYKFTKSGFLKGFSKERGLYNISPKIQTIYDSVCVWPIKAYQIWWAAGRPSASRYLLQVFGGLNYPPGNVNVSIAEAFHGPMRIILNNAMSGSMLAQMVRNGSTNPSIVLADINGFVDGSVSAAMSFAASLNIPVAAWKDDTQSGYAGSDNPALVSLISNQGILKSYNNQNPLSMYDGAGNFRWIDEKSCNDPDSDVQKKCAFGNAFNMGWEGMSKTYSYMQIVAQPVQGVIQEKSHNVMLSPTLMDRLKESIWYGLANPWAVRGENAYISHPIQRKCDTSTCSKQTSGTAPISLPFSAKYAKLISFGSLLLDTYDDEGNNFQSVYDKFKDMDHSRPEWCLYLAQAQWQFILKALQVIYDPNPAIFYNNINMYFDPHDVTDVAFIIKFVVTQPDRVKDPSASYYTPPQPIT